MADTESDNDGLFVAPEEMEKELAEGAIEYTGPLPSAEALDEDSVARAAQLSRATERAEHSGSSLSVQGMKFIIAGGISAIPDLGLTFILQMFFGVGATLARTFGFILGTITAYLLNRRWTFQAEPSARRFGAVALLYTVTWGVNVGLHRFGFELFTGWGWHDALAIVVAYVIAQGTATVVNFVVQRTIIFRFI